MNWLITFGGANYEATTQLIVDRAPTLGADRVLVYDDKWLTEQPFYRLNKWIFEHQGDIGFGQTGNRGLGWYCWKPFIIQHTIDHFCATGDVVMYNDADSVPERQFGHLYQECRAQGGVKLYRANPWKNNQWCKADCYVAMGQNDPKYRDPNLNAGVARFCLFEKGPWLSKQFLMEWLVYALNPAANTFDKSVYAAENPEFTEHRTEQAIMTLLAYKYDIPLEPELDYEQGIFNQINHLGDTRRTAEIIGSKYRNV